MSTDLVIQTQPSSLVAVDGQCAAIEAWAEQCESVPELRDAGNKLAAIDEYLNRTSTEGRSRVAAAMRRLEARIGSLLGPAQHGGDRRSDQVPREELDPDLPRNRQSDFRAMAEHPEVVEEVIAKSTDEAPASRRKVMAAIQANPRQHPTSTVQRIAKAREMAAKGATSRQIAEAIGISQGGMTGFKARHRIEVPADAVVGKSRVHDSNRILRESVAAMEGVVMGLDLVDLDDLDAVQIEGWADSLSDSLRSLNRFHKQLKEYVRGQG